MKWRYILYNDGSEELYNQNEDPSYSEEQNDFEEGENQERGVPEEDYDDEEDGADEEEGFRRGVEANEEQKLPEKKAPKENQREDLEPNQAPKGFFQSIYDGLNY